MTEAPEADFVRPFDDRLTALGWQRTVVEMGTGFDQAVAYYAQGAVRLRVVRDRGPVSVDVAPAHRENDPAAWSSLDLALVSAGVPSSEDAHPGDASVDDALDRLATHGDVLAQAFRPSVWPMTERRLKTLGEERVRRMFPNLKRAED